jgi:uncharacterized membrane protein
MSDAELPVRLALAALFVAARIVGGRDGYSREDLVQASIADADELLKQAPP